MPDFENVESGMNILKFFDTEENIVGKDENVGDQYFLPFPQYFQKASSLRVMKIWDCLVKGK